MKKRISVLTVLFFVITLILIVFVGKHEKEQYANSLYGRVIDDDDVIYHHHSLFPFSYPFLDISIYRIAESDINYFQSPPLAFFEEYPLFDHLDVELIYKKWSATPAMPEEFELFASLLDTMITLKCIDEDNSMLIRQTIKSIRNGLQNPGGYWAYSYLSGRRTEFHCFIILPEDRLMIRYMINRTER